MLHPDDNTLSLFSTGQLAESEECLLESHLEQCEECQKRLDLIERQCLSLDPFIYEIKQGKKIYISQFDELSPGSQLSNQFRLEEKIGTGGMGVVYKAYDTQGKRHVVLKFLLPYVLRFSETKDNLRETFQKVHMLQHSNICPLIGLFEDTHYGLYLVMKYIDGDTLAMYRKSRPNGVLSVEEVAEILKPAAEALDYAHEHKVIHRDIKPQNIMISKTDGVQIIDFDLADAIRSSISSHLISQTNVRIVGTRVYMAPKQWEGKPKVHSDQYALAVTAYELLAGKPPFVSSRGDTEILRHAVLQSLPDRIPDLSDQVNYALLRGLAKVPYDRFASCSEFVAALSGDQSVEYVPVPPLQKDVGSGKQIRIGWILLFLALVFFAVAGSVFVWMQFFNQNNMIPEPVPIEIIKEKPKEQPQGKPLYPTRNELFRTIRYSVVIDELGIVYFRIKRGYSGEPYPAFNGTAFPFIAIAGGTAYRGKSGRVVFPLGLLESTTPSSPIQRVQINTGPEKPKTSFGWTYNVSGMEWTNRQISRFTEGMGTSRAGFSISKNQKLPVSLGFEVVDDPNCNPPDMSINIRTESPGMRQKYTYNMAGYAELQNPTRGAFGNFDPGKTWTVSCTGRRQKDDTILFIVDVKNPSSDSFGYNYNADNNAFPNKNEALANGESMEKKLILTRLQNVSQNACNITYTVRTRSGTGNSSGKRSRFDLTYLDMAGTFEGANDLLFELAKQRFPIKNFETRIYSDLPSGSMYSIEGVNGSSSPEKIVDLINNLKFGEPITLNVKKNPRKNSSLPPTSEDRIIYAQ
ncbi:MAG: protein kinase [Planctomycetia bacterium]|nr:protein kinase [Planctomycetia bacterium]